MNDIPVGVDSTDHLEFFCPACRDQDRIDQPMDIVRVETKRIIVNTETGTRDKCTWIHLQCPLCKDTGQRKSYWTCADGQDLERTDR